MPSLASVAAAIAVAAAVAVFVNYPPPPLSPALTAWKQRGQYFTHQGANIFYIDESSGKNADTLVCLHGFPTSSYDWSKVWADLQGHFGRVIALDYIGFGFSDKPVEHEYSILEQADIVEHLLAHLGVTSVHILAHDYGDTVAQELLARFEDGKKENTKMELNIETTCLLNGGIFPETHFPRIGQKVLVIPILGPVLSRLMFYRAFKRSFGEVFGPKTQPTEPDLEDFWAAVRYNDGHKVAHSLLQYIRERRENRGRWVGALQLTSVPVHVIYGPADPVNPIQFAEYYSTAVPEPSITILGDPVGHYPQWEAPHLTIHFYLNFLESLNT